MNKAELFDRINARWIVGAYLWQYRTKKAVYTAKFNCSYDYDRFQREEFTFQDLRHMARMIRQFHFKKEVTE